MPAATALLATANLLLSRRFLVSGKSMWPTLAPGQHVLARPVARDRTGPQRGDVVVMRHPLWGESVLIKRVIGKPDEYIYLGDDGIYIDDRRVPLEEPYLNGPPCPRTRHPSRWFTGPKEYFLLGDNRSDSLDSRSLGPVPVNCILGLVWLRCWPPNAWGTISANPERGA